MCDCIKEINEQLKPHNARIAAGVSLKDNTMQANYYVMLEKIDTAKRKPLPYMVMSYCPFCGEKLESCDD